MKKKSLLTIALFFTAITGLFSQKLEFYIYKQEWNENLPKLIKAFEKSHPGITIETLLVPYNQDQTLNDRAQTGILPDLIQLQSYAEVEKFAKGNYLLDLSQEPFWTKFYPWSKPAVTFGKGLYAQPTDFYSIGVLYNKKLFKKLGLSVPVTFSELKTTTDKIKAKGLTPFAGLFRENWSIGHFLSLVHTAFLEMKNGPKALEQFVKAMNKETTTYAGAVDWKRVLRFLDFYRSNVERNARERTWDDQQSAFTSSEAVMMVQGLWSYYVAKKTNPNLDVGFFPFPLTEEPKQARFSVDIDSGIAISAQSTKTKQDAARKFLNWLVTPEAQTIAIKELNILSCVSNADLSPLGPPALDLQKSIGANGIWSMGFSLYPNTTWEGAVKNFAHAYVLRTKNNKALSPVTIDQSWKENK